MNNKKNLFFIGLFFTSFILSISITVINSKKSTQSSVNKIDSVKEFLSKQTIIVEAQKFHTLKIGVIDIGQVDWSKLPQVSYNQYILDSNENQEHGHYVTNEIVSELNAKGLLSKVQIVYCQVSKFSMILEQCLDIMLLNQVQITNVSMSFGKDSQISLLEILSFGQLLNNSKVVFSAGNDGQESGNALCDMKSVNKICVGGYNQVEIDPKSNYGKNVDVYEPYYAKYSNYIGTSFSAPMHVAKIASLMLQGKDYKYHASSNRNLASH